MSASDRAVSPDREYRRFVLSSAMKRTWESSRVFAIVTVVNAAIQALLILPAPIYGINTPLFIFLGMVSYIVLLASVTLVIGAALRSGRGPSTIRGAYRHMRPRLGRFLFTTLIWTVACIAGLLFWGVPGFILLATTPFVLIAAADGDNHPLRDNFRAIKYRFGRYVAVLIVNMIVLFLMYLGSFALNFFLNGALAAFIVWLYVGFLGTWLLSGWALLWRSTPPGQASAERDFTSSETNQPPQPAGQSDGQTS